MKKIFLTFMVLLSCVFASDELSIDSLFKKQIGLKVSQAFLCLVQEMQILMHFIPNIIVGGDPKIWNDTKQVFLTQTFIYTLTPNFDILVSGGGSYARQEYRNFLTGDFENKNRIGFDNLWLGFIYTGDSIADLIPQITFQTAVVQREKAINQTKNFYLKSQSLQASLRGYSDPVVYSIYTGFGYNQSRKFKTLKIEYGNSIYVGGDLSIILSPKITLDLGAE